MEGATNAHGFANAFHGSGEDGFCPWEFFEGKAGDFGNDVVEGGFERGGSDASDIVLEFVEGVPDGQFGSDLGDRVAGGLGGEGGGAGDAGIHFDNDHSSCAGADSKLDIGTACLDADFADNGKGGVAHALELAIGQSLGWGDGDAVAGVNSHGIEVFDGADDDAVIGVIAHDLHFVLFPAEKGFFDQDFGSGGSIET